MNTILEYLNQKVDASDAFLWGSVILVVWCILWWLFLGQWLSKHDVGTFWHDMFEAGPFGTFGIALVVLLLIVLLVTSFQAVFVYGPKMIASLVSFWAIIIISTVLIIRYLKK